MPGRETATASAGSVALARVEAPPGVGLRSCRSSMPSFRQKPGSILILLPQRKRVPAFAGTTVYPLSEHKARGRFSPRPLQAFLNPSVLFCTAACNPSNNSFTIEPHPDVGEGAGPLPVSTVAGFFYCVAAGDGMEHQRDAAPACDGRRRSLLRSGVRGAGTPAKPSGSRCPVDCAGGAKTHHVCNVEGDERSSRRVRFRNCSASHCGGGRSRLSCPGRGITVT